MTWNREEGVFRGDFIASARGTSFGTMDNRSNEGPFATPLPIAKSPGIVSTAPGGAGCYIIVSYKGFRNSERTGDEVTITAGGTGEGDVFRGGVCTRGGGV